MRNESNGDSLDSELDSEQESRIAVQTRYTEKSHSTEHNEGDDPITDINVTPLVDVALVLVIIFMAVSPFMLQAGLTVSESKAGAAKGKNALDENVQVKVSADNKIVIDGAEVLLENLLSTLKVKIPKTKDQLVTLQAETTNRVGFVVEILDIAKQAGAKKVAILNKTEDDIKEKVAVPK